MASLGGVLAGFRVVDVGGRAGVEALVGRARRLGRGVTPRELREAPPVRERVAAQCCARLKPGGFLITCPADLQSSPPAGMVRQPFPEAVVFQRTVAAA